MTSSSCSNGWAISRLPSVGTRGVRSTSVRECSTGSISLTYLTQAAYLLDEYMGVTSTQFPMVFAGFVADLMIANRCNAFLLRIHDSLHILRRGVVAVLTISIALLVAVLSAGMASVWVIGCVLLLISSLGFVNSNSNSNSNSNNNNSQVNFLHYFGESSGTDTSIMRASQLMLGASAGAVVSFFYDSTPLPLASVMFIAATHAFVNMRKVSRTAGGEQTAASL